MYGQVHRTAMPSYITYIYMVELEDVTNVSIKELARYYTVVN